MLYYDDGTRKKGFEENWRVSLKDILPETSFPDGMQITGMLEDVTEDFGCEESAIKVGKSIHGSNTIVYHIFVNINYRLKIETGKS